MKTPVIASLVALGFVMLACSFGASESEEKTSSQEMQTAYEELPAGDPERGEQTFLAQPCHTCHVELPVGPAFPGDPPLAALAAGRRSGHSAEVYLYESIVEPNAYIVPGFKKDIMPGEFGGTLTAQQLADLVAYLMTMK